MTPSASKTGSASEAVVDELLTVRDWLRYATSSFSRAGLVYGHGTTTALDEAAFLLLMALDLPVDDLAPWLDARLPRDERARIARLIDERIATRKPAAYLVQAAFIQGHRFYVDERVIVPRSYIGELLIDALQPVVEDPAAVSRVLDMCSGSGCLAILAALAFEGAQVDAVELSAGALDVASRNIASYGLTDRIALIQSDLFGAVPGDARYNLIIANPPYVATAEVAAFDAEYRAEPVMAHEGGADGLDLVRRIVADAPRYLAPRGLLVIEIGTGREAFERTFPNLDVIWLETATSTGEVVAIFAEALAAKPVSARRRAAKANP